MFSVALKARKDLSINTLEPPVSLEDLDLDETEGILGGICLLLEARQDTQFFVSGFGEQVWAVDISTDLASIIEQLPEVVTSLQKRNYPVEIYFYGQGIDRRLVCESNSSSINVTCDSGTSWVPRPRTLILNEEEFLLQFLDLKTSFIECARQVAPHLAATQQFTSWVESFSLRE
jgi:hypothetical protein